MLEDYPNGGCHSFLGALAVSVVALIIVLWRSYKDKDESIKEQISWWLAEDTIIKGALLAVTFIALWLTIRLVLYHGRLLLFDEEYNYRIYVVFDIIAYVLGINLCITLLKARDLKQIANASMQSVLLAILLFLPRATSKDAQTVYGLYGSAVILVGFATLIVSLAYVSKHVLEEKKNPPSFSA